MKDHPFLHLESLDLDELADRISEYVHNPITIEDFNHRLIAYSTHGNGTDQARMETIMGRRVPKTVLNRLWQDGVIQKLMGCDDPIRIQAKNEVGLGNRVAISIRRGHSVLGYIWVLEVNHPMGPDEMQHLRQAARAAMPKLYQRQTRRRIQEEKSKEFFWELLLGNISSHHDIQTKAEDIGIRLPKPFSIFLFETDDPQFESVHKEMIYLLSNLHDSFPHTTFPLWVTNQKQLIIMGGGGDERMGFHERSHAFVEDMQKRIRDRIGDSSTLGTFGQPSANFQRIERSYHQALTVLRMKKALPMETRGIYGYADLGIYRLLPFIAEKNAAEEYVNPQLAKLTEYDQENESQLLHTLEVYLECAGRVNAVSQKLHIHPNTLAYRLKRISEVSGIDLEDPNQRISMFIDIKLKKLPQ